MSVVSDPDLTALKKQGRRAQRLAAIEKRKVNTCNFCAHSFSCRGNLLKHKRNIHKIPMELTPTGQFKCSECNKDCVNTANIIRHYQETHGEIALKDEELTFKSVAEFVVWKEDVETNTAARFVTRAGLGKRRRSSFTVERLHCHRSGVYQSRGAHKRALKMSGSNKIGSFCPARMTIWTDLLSKSVKVQFQSTHVGHQCEPARLPLSKRERCCLAEQMFQGMTKDRILENVARTFSPSKRISLTKRKDLHNIAASFKLKSNGIIDETTANRCELVTNVSSTDELNTTAQSRSNEIVISSTLEGKKEEARSRLVALLEHIDSCTTDAEVDSLILILSDAKSHWEAMRSVTSIEPSPPDQEISEKKVSNREQCWFVAEELVTKQEQQMTNGISVSKAAVETFILVTTTV